MVDYNVVVHYIVKTKIQKSSNYACRDWGIVSKSIYKVHLNIQSIKKSASFVIFLKTGSTDKWLFLITFLKQNRSLPSSSGELVNCNLAASSGALVNCNLLL